MQVLVALEEVTNLESSAAANKLEAPLELTSEVIPKALPEVVDFLAVIKLNKVVYLVMPIKINNQIHSLGQLKLINLLVVAHLSLVPQPKQQQDSELLLVASVP